MSTRALVGMPNNKENIIHYIQVGRDGYPDYTGDILFNSYVSENKINNLLACGNLSYIANSVTDCGLYHEPESTLNFTLNTEEDTFKKQINDEIVDYGYLFIHNQWKCWSSDGTEIDLEEILADKPLNKAKGLVKYVITQAESLQPKISNTCKVNLQNIISASKDIEFLLYQYRS
ncbi:hypothetical protein AGMMS49944_31010 [Spirochaetia bacterium]|nr:hypothetical protein AGMMS49944_31010 [Spirochaetia bacterium]